MGAQPGVKGSLLDALCRNLAIIGRSSSWRGTRPTGFCAWLVLSIIPTALVTLRMAYKNVPCRYCEVQRQTWSSSTRRTMLC